MKYTTLYIVVALFSNEVVLNTNSAVLADGFSKMDQYMVYFNNPITEAVVPYTDALGVRG